jgi:hypothetical protein
LKMLESFTGAASTIASCVPRVFLFCFCPTLLIYQLPLCQRS